MIPKRAIFFCDSEKNEKERWNVDVKKRGLIQKILVHLGVNEIKFLESSVIQGFCSGIDWDKEKNNGAIAIVLYGYYNMETILGILNEVVNLNIKVYGIYDSSFYCYSDINVTLPKGIHINNL